MKILLISPPLFFKNVESYLYVGQLPLGLAYISAVLEEAGYRPVILDAAIEGKIKKFKKDIFRFGLTLDSIKKKIVELNPDVVGISCFTLDRLPYVIKISKITKRINKNIKVVVGGTITSPIPERILKHDSVDFVILGEGEYTFLKIIEKIEKNCDDFSKIDGLAYKENGKIKINPKKMYIKNLDKLPLPARHLFPLEKYFHYQMKFHGHKKLSILTSRGCPNNCSFCYVPVSSRRIYRKRSPKNVVDEIEYLIKKYDVKQISIVDDNFSFDLIRAKKIFREIIKRKLKFFFDIQSEIMSFDQSLLKLMKKAGLRQIYLPIESGDKFVLKKIMNKKMDLVKVRKIAKICNKLGLYIIANIVLGMPGETKKSIVNTMKFVLSLPIHSLSINFATPFPGTDLYQLCEKKGYINKKHLLNSLIYDPCACEKPYIETKCLSKKELLIFEKSFFLRFLLKKISSPKTLFKEAKRPRFVLPYLKHYLKSFLFLRE